MWQSVRNVVISVNNASLNSNIRTLSVTNHETRRVIQEKAYERQSAPPGIAQSSCAGTITPRSARSSRVRLGHRVVGHNREPMLRTTANQLWTRVVPAARQAYPAAGVAVSPHARSRTPVGRVIRPGRTRLFCPLPPRQSPTLTSGASPLPPQTQRTFAAAAADDDAHAVSDTPESKPRFTPSTATRRALFGTPSSDHRPISRHRRSPR